MNIAIIGAGFTGLAAAIELQKKGHTVTLFEKESLPGGLAIGFKAKNWEWSLEKHYHHIFTSDKFIQNLAAEVGLPFTFIRPNTSSLIGEEIFQVDSPLTLLQFSKLSITDRLRMGVVLGYLKYVANWRELEKVTAHEWLKKMMGKKAYTLIWEPLFRAKFSNYADTISLAWFWARIKARTTKLGYPDGGFQNLAEQIAKIIQEKGGVIHFDTTVKKIEQKDNNVEIFLPNKTYLFDKVLLTLPNFFFSKLAPQLPEDYKKKLMSFEGIGAVNMVLELDKPFLPDDVYWLSICDRKYPFIAVVEHTNFIDKKYYDNHHLVYVGNYLPQTHKYYSYYDEELLQEFDPYLRKFNPNYRQHLLKHYVFKVPYAQPIVPVNYYQKILPFQTPLKNVYLANMQQVYPWDRGTNYAIEMGQNVAQLINKENN